MTTPHSTPESRAQDKAKAVAGDANRAANEKLETVKTQAVAAAGEAKERAYETGEKLKTAGVRRIDDLADDVERRAAEQDSRVARPVMKGAANGMRDIAQAIDGASLDELTGALARSARRNPMMFTVGAFFAGFAASRFLTARADDDPRGEMAATPAPRAPRPSSGLEATPAVRPGASAYPPSAEPIPSPATKPAPAVAPVSTTTPSAVGTSNMASEPAGTTASPKPAPVTPVDLGARK